MVFYPSKQHIRVTSVCRMEDETNSMVIWYKSPVLTMVFKKKCVTVKHSTRDNYRYLKEVKPWISLNLNINQHLLKVLFKIRLTIKNIIVMLLCYFKMVKIIGDIFVLGIIFIPGLSIRQLIL